jgi:hypothetical protein
MQEEGSIEVQQNRSTEVHKKTPPLPSIPSLNNKLFVNAHLTEALEKKMSVRNQSVIDIDRLDGNILELKKLLPSNLKIRLRVGSLPNPHLVLYLSHKLNTQKLYVVHPGILFEMLYLPQFENFDIWLGRNIPKQVFDSEFWQKDPSIWDRLAKTVSFQVGSKEELGELIRFSHSISKPLKVCLDFDCGKRRGGFRKIKELDHALKMIRASDGAVVLRGVSASDEHLPLTPVIFSRWITSLQAQFAKTQSLILLIKESLRTHGFGSEVPVLGGCSRTLPLHLGGSHLDEFAVGSVFLAPSYVTQVVEYKKLEPALYIASPVMYSEKYFRAPFMGFWMSFLYQKLFYRNHVPTWVAGGPWGGVWAHEGIKEAPRFLNQRKQARLLPDQSFLWLSEKMATYKNKILLMVPDETDLMLAFNETVVLREGSILGAWRNFRNTH